MSDTIDALEAAVAPKIAEMQLLGMPITWQISAIKDQLNITITRRQYNRLLKSDTYKEVMATATDQIKRNAVADLVRRTSDLVPLIDSALRKALEDGQVQAIPHALKILGIDKHDDTPQQAQQLTVVLPGGEIKDVSTEN